jgi:predicted Fe-Mo cluster-binding NifX family protein
MRIAIPSSGPAVTDPFDTRFGRAPYIILVTPETGETVSIQNSLATGSGGVGPQVVQLLVQNQVTHLIAPRIGGNAETALFAAGIKVFIWEGAGMVSTALEQFKAGKLSELAKNPQSS